MTKYLVTGGSGFCGFEILKYLRGKGHAVRVLDVEPPPENIPNVDFLKGDIRDPLVCDRACRGADRVIHAAAKVPITKAGRDFYSVNVQGTRNLLEAAKRNGVKKVVHLSSSAVLYGNRSPVSEDAPYRPLEPYSDSKAESEKVCKEYVEKGLPIDIIRPRTVVGAGRLGIFDVLFEWVSEGCNVYILGKGDNQIQFLHPEDLASCCYLASAREESDVFNIGSRTWSTLRRDLEFLISYAHSRSKIVSFPLGPAVFVLKVLDFCRLSPMAPLHYKAYYRDLYFSNHHAQSVLGWEPTYGNREILEVAYETYLKMKANHSTKYGKTHRRRLKQRALRLLKIPSAVSISHRENRSADVS